MATSQAQSAIDKLKQAGLKRSQFSVTTERRYCGKHPDTGKEMYEYGDAQIHLKGVWKNLLPFAEAMAKAGLHVEIWKFDTVTSMCVTDEYGKSGLWKMDWTDTDDYGLPKTKRVM